MKGSIRHNLRRAMRSALAFTRAFLDQDETRTRPDFSNDDYAYPYLNHVFVEALRNSKKRLRPNYTWGVLHAAFLANAIGIPRISVAEFGVAGGNGLLALENAADIAEEKIGVKIDVFGFDTGTGLPPPVDYRDMPNLYAETAYRMDVDELQKRLTRAQLKLGLIEATLPSFLLARPAPVGFIAVDVDYYSSTMHVLKLLDSDPDVLLPRIHCYFDDMLGFTCSEFTGERLAIAEFNQSHTARKISPVFGLKFFLPARYRDQPWADLMYIAHIFDHDLYGRRDGLVQRTTADRTSLRAGRTVYGEAGRKAMSA